MSTESEVVEVNQEKKIIDAVFWGGSLLWAGIVFGLDTFNYLPQIGAATVWSWIFLGMGIYGLILNLIRFLSPSLSNATTWDWVWGIVFLVIGAAGFASFSIPWWLFLILFGVVILINAFRGRS